MEGVAGLADAARAEPIRATAEPNDDVYATR